MNKENCALKLVDEIILLLLLLPHSTVIYFLFHVVGCPANVPGSSMATRTYHLMASWEIYMKLKKAPRQYLA